MADDLEENRRDLIAATMRAAAGAVPWGGGALSEVFTRVIPNQRIDRIVSYVRALESRLSFLEQSDREAIFNDPERVDFIEEGAFQSARATTTERIERIVELVSNGLSDNETETVRRKRLLRLLGEIDDDQLLLLNAYGQSYGGDGTEAWEKIEHPDPTHMQSSKEEFDREALYELGRETLLRLGLLRRHFRTPRRGEAPEFDSRSGQFKHSVEISELGRILLREIGIKLPIDEY